MYDTLIADLRKSADLMRKVRQSLYMDWDERQLRQAADAIEELQAGEKKFLRNISVLETENENLKRARCWIPVTERLPEENGRYIVAYEDATSVLDFFNGKWFFPWHSSPGCIAWEEEGTIQAWMPMPEPPKEET
jgi:hypothetical protein